MKYQEPQPQPKLKAKPPVSKPNTEIKFDVFKWIGLFISLIGIFAWIAGESYIRGYWATAGNVGPLIQPSLQNTALLGFSEAYRYWYLLPGVIALIGMEVFLLGIESRKERESDKSAGVVTVFLEKRFKLDPKVAAFGAMIFSIAFIVAWLFFVMHYWIVLPNRAGGEDLEKVVCQARLDKKFPTVVMLSDGKNVSGILLDHTEKTLIVLDQTMIYRIATGEKSQILSSTSTSAISCSSQ